MIKCKDNSAKFIGSTCYIRNESIQVMSDIWESVLVAYSISEDGHMSTTQLWDDLDGKPQFEVEIDVTDAALQRFWQCQYDLALNQLYDQAEEDSVAPFVKGRTVRVVRGRTNKDVEGKVVVVMQAIYQAGYRGSLEYKLGIATSDRKVKVLRNGREFENYADVVWVWARNCEVVNPQVPSRDSFDEEAKNIADSKLQVIKNSIRDYWIYHGKKFYPFQRAA